MRVKFPRENELKNGNVGIGTTGPNAPLHVFRTGGAETLRLESPTVNGTQIVFLNTQATQHNWTAAANYNTSNAFEITPSTANGGTTFSIPAVTILSTGNVGIGTTGPNTIFHVKSADNTINTTLQINALQANIDGSDKWVSFTSNSGEEANVVGTGVVGVVAYNTFTGAHKTLVEGPTPEMLMLLEMTGTCLISTDFTSRGKLIDRITAGRDGKSDVTASVYTGPAPKEFLPRTRICATKRSNACLGVYAGTDSDDMAMALALGTGWIRVVNTGLNLTPGDYLISSSVAGYAEKQDDNIKRASTVASVSENVTWLDREVTRRVACRYLMG